MNRREKKQWSSTEGQVEFNGSTARVPFAEDGLDLGILPPKHARQCGGDT